MKEQFLDDIGLEELIGYIKKYVKDDQDVKPYASYSVFPKTGEQNIIYIDTTNNLTYYWDDTSKTYKALDVQTWDNLSGKPSTFPPSTHNHDDRYYTETEINTKLAGKANSSHTHKKADITDFPTSMPASDVKPWAKADTKPSYSKSEIGLGNVDNTADKDKSVKYANSAGKLSTSRTISLTGSVTGSGSFDGSGNLTISTATSHTHNSVADINSGATTTFAYSKAGMGYGDFTWLAAWNGSELRAVNKSLFATTGHTHSYLPLSGGTMGGTAFITWADSGNWSNNNKNVTFPVNRGGLQWNGQSDYVKLFTQETGKDNLELVLQFGDDNSNGLSIRNNVGSETARITSTGVFTGTFSGNLSGKASTAGTADVANSVAWSNVSGKPGTFTPSSHTHTNIVSRGRKNPCASGTTGNNADAEVNVTGLSLTEAYNASTPTSFGNIINVIGANSGGAGQLFLGWSGADSVTEHLYYRSHRNTTTGGWGPWRTVAFTTDNVASANTLTSNAGSATQPIYFSGGKPVACSYSLSKSVPSNAVFTDTNTWRGIQNNLSSDSTSDSLSAAQGKRLKNLIDEKTDIHNLNYGIRFSSSSMDSNGSQNTLYPAKYENGAYSKSTGVSTYANRNNTIHIGTSANMFGDIYLAGGITSLGVYNVTTTTNIPVSVTSQGYLRRYKSGSSLMIKNHIYKIGYDEAKELLNTNVYSFRYNDDGQPANGKEHAAVNRYGFVLEDMEKTFPMAVEYDENGLPAAWCVQIIVPTILEIVKHQQAEISSLKAENKELKEKISEIDKLKKSLDELRELITNK